MHRISAVFLLLAIILFPSLVLAHSETECLRHAETDYSFGWLKTVLYAIGLLIVISAFVLLWVILGLSLDFLVVAGFLAGMYSTWQGLDGFLALPAGFWAVVGCVVWASFFAWLIIRLSDGDNTKLFVQVLSGICLPAFLVITYTFDSSFAGFFSVVAFAAIIINVGIFDAAGSAVGIPGVKISGRMTLTGLLILVGYLLLERLGLDVTLFTFGALYLSAIIINTNLLIGTWSTFEHGFVRYILREILFLSYAFISVVYGQELGASALVKMGGTFIAIWVLMKAVRIVYEIIKYFGDALIGVVILLIVGVGIIYSSSYLADYTDFLASYILFL